VRHGFNNSTFTVFKFRSMLIEGRSAHDVQQATAKDPRVTRVGWLLRRSSLDELPQLFNVLKGDMSLVGPRPHAVPHSHLFGDQIEDYFCRHRLKPGITGWAQVNALRGETQSIDKMRARVEHDLYYIDNWSLWLDLKILLRTVMVMVHPTAY
jgi:putative colanic acid biosynthesis UDP-glucose lipid carrier transferase